jgi:Protein of unknown function (DUF1592)/Protein of unknown function (DUF1588)/Protein of unknown function (DUF1595)/Protein of unknown function (DUF1585)/Protein of unknown function (DUF1587)
MSYRSSPLHLRILTLGVSALALTTAACTASITDSDATGAGGSGASGTVGPGTGGASPSGGSASTAGSGPIVTTPGQLNLSGQPKYYRVVRLTNEQWTNSVQNVLSLPSRPSNAESFQNAVSGTTDFTNNELVLGVDSRSWSDFQAAAEELAKQVASDAALLGKLYSGTDGAGFIASVGRRVYRRPLTPAETSTYQKLFDGASTYSGTLSNFAKGAGVVLEAMLQSPHFLYRTELGAVGAPLSGYEMAAKLSLWLRNSGPDTALLDSAATLETPDGAATAAQKMLEEPAAKAVMRNFHGEFLHFGRYANLSKVGVEGYDPAINSELAESSYLFFDKIFSQGLGLKEVFLSTKGFVGPKMAPLYGGSAAGAATSGFAEVDLGANRLGYFLQLPFLTLYSHNDEPDSIHRGVSMSLDVLCSVLGPPAGTIPPLPARMPGQTNRMRVDAHTAGCGAACHNQIINPLGFAFENFDGMGQFKETETHGTEVLPIDASGAFNFVEGNKTYKNAAELMQVLSTDKQAHLCYSKKLADFALQRSLVAADMPLLTELSTISLSGGGSVKQVLVNLVKQDAFRVRAGGAQ